MPSARENSKNNVTPLVNDMDADPPKISLPEDRPVSQWHDPFIHVLLVLAAGFIVYANTLESPFVFDDLSNLVANPVFRDFGRLPGIAQFFGWSIDTGIQAGMYLRPVVFFTFAVNYALHGLSPVGFHVTNLLIHICNAVMVYLFFSGIYATPAMNTGGAEDAEEKRLWYLPLFAALVFVSHPVQTGSVTYIIQRLVPLATFFYLGSLLLYGISRTATVRRTRTVSYCAALAAAILAMGSKEMAFTLPVVIALYEFIFFEGRILARLARLIPFMLTMSIIPLKLIKLSSLNPLKNSSTVVQAAFSVHNVDGISSIDYLITQFGVIATYIRLLLFPVRQNLDYDYRLQKVFLSLDVIAPLLLLLTIAGCGAWCLVRSGRDNRYRIIAFGIFWFFITLSVESSFVPIKDLIFEHRVYLPSIGFFMALITGSGLVCQRVAGLAVESSKKVSAFLVLLVVILSITAISRNRVWKSEISLWRDVVSKSPGKSRAHENLATALHNAALDTTARTSFGRHEPAGEVLLEEAVREYREAIRLDPKAAISFANLAGALTAQQKYDEALRTVEMAISLKPGSPEPVKLKGDIYAAKGDLDKAEQAYREAMSMQPGIPSK